MTHSSMTRISTIAIGAVALVALGGCVAGSTDSQHAAGSGILSLLLLGLWHGIISPFTLIGEIINAISPHLLPWKIELYETHAASVAYDVGFYLGLAGSPIVVHNRWRARAVH